MLLLAFGGDLDRLIYHMKRLTESAGRALRAARSRPALGARRVLRLHPWSEPRTLREPGGHRVPSFRIGARGIDGRKTAAAAALETRQFRHDHHRIRLARREGDPTARFPFGTYAWNVYHHAPVEPAPKPGALVTQPGPLLCDVQLQLEAMKLETRQQLHRQSLQLLDESRAAFDDESAELVADDHLDFERDEPSFFAGAPAEAAHQPRPEHAVAHRHRFDPDPRNGFQSVRRIVTLRDARRGRPPARPTRHGADPPR